MRTGTDKCGHLVPVGLSKLADIWQTGADRCPQLWFLGVSLSWGTFGGQVRTGADISAHWVSIVVGGHLADTWRTGADRCGQVRTVEDKSDSWVPYIDQKADS